MNLVTLFPDCNNVGLIKDVGQIPLQLAKSYGVETVLVTGDIDLNGDFVELARGFKIRKLKKLFSNGKLEVIAYILLNAKKIDWLNIYIGEKTYIDSGSRIEAIIRYEKQELSPKIEIGDRVSIGQNLHMTCGEHIRIEDDVTISAGVLITDISHTHKELNVNPLLQPLETEPVHIGRYS